MADDAWRNIRGSSHSNSVRCTKTRKIVRLFPLAAVHGMLAAIGLIVISKQLHILLGVNPLNGEGKPMIEPFELIEALPATFALIQQNMNVVIIGLISLITAVFVPMLNLSWLKKSLHQ